MTHLVRMAKQSDIEQLMALASFSSGGLTNFPHDRPTLEEKIRWSEQSCAASISEPTDELYLFVLEEKASGRIVGTSSIYSKVGVRWPFYSYKLNLISHKSAGIDRHFSTQTLSLVNDFDGASEVGGLFLHPQARSGGLGQLLAKSRYLFIALHRERFASHVIADLRGWLDGTRSPFWDAVGRRFFDKELLEADHYNATHGNQFIADLMPRFPIYTALLSDEARAVIGKPHDEAVPAMAMLEAEGFVHDGYVDIFDAGPTLCVKTDRIRSIIAARPASGGIDLLLETVGRTLHARGTRQGFAVSWVNDTAKQRVDQ